ncbi:unnamed protein product [Durusdinium trenchii]|uniref:Glycosyltransferase family 28 N-terminal domain-containing protein n=1 Tax=Durusdinium trenchii TaxID=1381693 RepID=A0ABP0HJK4_9DINO
MGAASSQSITSSDPPEAEEKLASPSSKPKRFDKLCKMKSFGSFGTLERLAATEKFTSRTLRTSNKLDPPSPLGRAWDDAPALPVKRAPSVQRREAASIKHISTAPNLRLWAAASPSDTEDGSSPVALGTPVLVPTASNLLGFDWDALDEDEDEKQEERPISRQVSMKMAKSSGSLAMVPEEGPQLKVALPLVPCSTPLQPVSAPSSPTWRGMRIAIVVNGSRGDVQPMVALAQKLQEHGHEVIIFTNADSISFCNTFGIDAVSVFADCSAVIQQSGGMSGDFVSGVSRANSTASKWLRSNPGACAPVAECLQEFQPQLLVCGTLAVGSCIRYEAQTCVPVVYVFLCRELMNFFSDVLYLQPERPCFLATNPLLDSESLPANLRQTGTWDLPDWAEVPSKLQEFLVEKGDGAIAMGWGSMIAFGLSPEKMLALALRVLKSLNMHGVILGGWAKLDEVADLLSKGKLCRIGEDWQELAEFAAHNVCFVAEAPHTWLFPRCSCVVHHGGLGTTQAALRAGVPGVITPIFGDQFHNASHVNRLGVGVGLEQPLPQLSVAQIADAVRSAWSMAKAVRVR